MGIGRTLFDAVQRLRRRKRRQQAGRHAPDAIDPPGQEVAESFGADDAQRHYRLHVTFVTEKSCHDLVLDFGPEIAPIVRQLMSIFGAANEIGVSISDLQRATAAFKAKLAKLTDLYGSTLPELLTVHEMMRDLADGAYFMVLPAPVDTADEREARQQYLRRLNDPAANILASFRF